MHGLRQLLHEGRERSLAVGICSREEEAMRRHPDDEALLAFCEIDRSSGSERAGEEEALRDVRAHLAGGCERCRARAREFEIVVQRLRQPRLAEAPRAWIEKAIAGIFPMDRGVRRDAGVEALRGVLEEIRLALALDTRIGAPLAGIRGAAAARQFLFESDPGGYNASLHVQIGSSPKGKFGVRGQIVIGGGLKSVEPAESRPQRPPARAILRVNRPGPALDERTCRVTAGGEFHFRAVPEGRVQIRIESGTRLFIADPFDIR